MILLTNAITKKIPDTDLIKVVVLGNVKLTPIAGISVNEIKIKHAID